MTVEWQYNGVAPMYDIFNWCMMALPVGSWGYNKQDTLTFYEDSSWTWFRLRWL